MFLLRKPARVSLFLIRGVLCLAALNLTLWQTALSLHLIHHHCPPPFHHFRVSISAATPACHGEHPECRICDLFSQYHSKGGIAPLPAVVIPKVCVQVNLLFSTPIRALHRDTCRVRAPPRTQRITPKIFS